jgi:hypothetical protein
MSELSYMRTSKYSKQFSTYSLSKGRFIRENHNNIRITIQSKALLQNLPPTEKKHIINGIE